MFQEQNIKMADNNAPRSPTPEDHERSSKRQRSDTSNTLNLNPSCNDSVHETDQDSYRIKRKCEAIRSALYEIEVAEKSLEEEMNLLKMQVQLREVTIAELQKDLEMSRKETQEARRTQTATEIKFSQLTSQLKPIIGQLTGITPLMMDWSFGGPSTVSQSHEEVEKIQDSIPEPIVEKILGNVSISQKESNPENIQLKEARITIKRMTPEVLTHEQRKTLEVKKDLSVQKIVNEAEKLRQHDSSGGADGRDSSSDNNDSSSDQGHNEDDGSSSKASEEKPVSSDDHSDDDEGSVMSKNDPRILIGKKYPFFVSSLKFLKIYWKGEFTRSKQSGWLCTTCSYESKSKQHIQDHVWIEHYQGKFECPHCTDPPTHTTRSSLLLHIKQRHI